MCELKKLLLFTAVLMVAAIPICVNGAEAHKHLFTVKILKEPSCGVGGEEKYTCGCGYTYTIKLSPLRHCYKSSVTKAATCKSSGVLTYQCKRCGDSYTREIPSNSEHSPVKKGGKTLCATCGKVLKEEPAKTETKNKKKPAVKTETKSEIRKQKQTIKASGSGRETYKSSQETKAKVRKEDKEKLEKRRQRARMAAVTWAISIAGDDTFHYGKSKWAHHNGCYFCGTNQKKGSIKRKLGASLSECAKTYCCNPFVTAAFHHGAGAEEIDCRVPKKRINLANDRNKALKNKKSFERISKPKRISSLKPGDILLTPTHAMLYAGDGKVVHAAHHDNGKRDKMWNSSITYGKISDRQWKRVSKIYRYMGTGKF